MRDNGPCHAMGVTYDRGAGDFIFPHGTGVRVGGGTSFKAALLQVHYLLPKEHIGNTT